MKFTIKAIHIPASSALAEEVEKKIITPAKKLFGGRGGAASVAVELVRETKHHRKGQIWTVLLNANIGKKTIRIERSGESIHEAVDLCAGELKEDIKKFKGRAQSLSRRGARKAAKDIKMNRAARLFRKGRILDEGN